MRFDPSLPILDRKGEPMQINGEKHTTGSLAILVLDLVDGENRPNQVEKKRRFRMSCEIADAMSSNKLVAIPEDEIDVIDGLVAFAFTAGVYGTYAKLVRGMKAVKILDEPAEPKDDQHAA